MSQGTLVQSALGGVPSLGSGSAQRACNLHRKCSGFAAERIKLRNGVCEIVRRKLPREKMDLTLYRRKLIGVRRCRSGVAPIRAKSRLKA